MHKDSRSAGAICYRMKQGMRVGIWGMGCEGEEIIITPLKYKMLILKV
jgi:hypothetical protein